MYRKNVYVEFGAIHSLGIYGGYCSVSPAGKGGQLDLFACPISGFCGYVFPYIQTDFNQNQASFLNSSGSVS